MPPKIRGSTFPVIFAIIAVAAAVLGSGAILFFFDPSKHGFYPICLFHALTGWNCPGCGGTRAAYQLLHGHLLRALQDNALFVLALATLLIWGAWFLAQRLRRRPVAWALPGKVLWALLFVTLAFTVLRNLPAFAWLSP
jgi:hypothetical protein